LSGNPKEGFFSSPLLKPTKEIASMANEIGLCGATPVKVLPLSQPEMSNADMREIFNGAGRRMRGFSTHPVQYGTVSSVARCHSVGWDLA
jgi:hypothetical protein